MSSGSVAVSIWKLLRYGRSKPKSNCACGQHGVLKPILTKASNDMFILCLAKCMFQPRFLW